MKAIDIFEYQWPYLLTLLPPQVDLEASARQYGAIRRKRRINKASDLLRLALAYSFCQMSLRQTAAWAQVAQVADISDVALLKRLRSAADWLGFLLAAKLADRAGQSVCPPANLRLYITDATVITQPGSKGTDWRVHLGYNPSGQAIDHLELTTGKGGERFSRFSLQPGMLVLADRAYATRAGLFHVHQHNAHYIVRTNWKNVPLQQPDGSPFDLFPTIRRLPEADIGDYAVRIRSDKKRKLPFLDARLVVLRKSEEAARQTRSNILRDRSRKGCAVDPRSLEAAAYMLVLTSLPVAQMSAREILEMYRFRWQVELAFKRMKSLLSLGELPAKDPQLARGYLHAKLLAALLVDDLTERFLFFSPWGYRLV